MNSKKVGKFISELRKLKKITQTELADLLNVTNKAVSKWETGEGFPEITMVPTLANILGVTSDEILKGERSVNKVESNEAVLNKKFIMVSLICFIILLFSFVISITIAYASNNELIGLITLLIGLLGSIILYIIQRYNYLSNCSYDDQNKMLIYKFTAKLYVGIITVILLYMPLILNRNDSQDKSIILFKDYLKLAPASLFFSFLLSTIILSVHQKKLFGKTNKKIIIGFILVFIFITYILFSYLFNFYTYILKPIDSFCVRIAW